MLAEIAVAADLEARKDLAEMDGEGLTHKEDAVKVVWHELKREDLYLRIIARDALPLTLDSQA